MSSSKIQERNLDPNMGLAKESSVQEVLSAVGNMGGSQPVYSETIWGFHTVGNETSPTFEFTGQGILRLNMNSSNLNYVNIDGTEYTSSNGFSAEVCTFYFNEYVRFYMTGVPYGSSQIQYSVQLI